MIFFNANYVFLREPVYFILRLFITCVSSERHTQSCSLLNTSLSVWFSIWNIWSTAAGNNTSYVSTKLSGYAYVIFLLFLGALVWVVTGV